MLIKKIEFFLMHFYYSVINVNKMDTKLYLVLQKFVSYFQFFLLVSFANIIELSVKEHLNRFFKECDIPFIYLSHYYLLQNRTIVVSLGTMELL